MREIENLLREKESAKVFANYRIILESIVIRTRYNHMLNAKCKMQPKQFHKFHNYIVQKVSVSTRKNYLR